MTDKDTTPRHDDCDCNDEDCDCTQDIITLDMEDGSTKDFLLLDILAYEGQQYIALAELDSNEYDILRIEEKDENVEMTVIEDDELFYKVAAEFDRLFSTEEEEEEV